ncbi:MAG: hypothetical protein GWN93_05915 [Deltaproteobacteria bacterium]|nr:hypothetical protein [Deltaproteobacteria bacterium]
MGTCNGCSLERLKKKYGDRLYSTVVSGWPTYYVKGEEPPPEQGEPTHLEDGTPIRFVVAYMSEGHSNDEDCDLSFRRYHELA